MKRFLFKAAVLLAFLSAALPAHAQFLGYTSPQTVNQTVFNSTACTTSTTLKSVSVTNVGQSVHVATYIITGSTTSPTIVRIMASSDNANFFQISDDGMGSAGLAYEGQLTGYGSFPFVQVWVLGCGTGGTVTVNYSGTSVSTTNPAGASDITAYTKEVFVSASDAVTQSATITPPYGNSGGMLILSPIGGGFSTGSTLQVQSMLGFGGPVSTVYAIANNDLTQNFVVPNYPGSVITVTFTAGAGTNLFTLLYLFEKPGNLPLVAQCEKTVVINTAAAGPTQIISSTGAVRVCSISVSSATAEAVDFQQGTGTNCGTGNSQLTGLYHLAANTPASQIFPVGGLVAGSANAVCIHLSGANQTDGTITYSQY